MAVAALPYPPIAAGFLAMFDGRTASVVWENPALGLFGIVVPPPCNVGQVPQQQHFSLPDMPPQAPKVTEMVVDIATDVIIPTIPVEDRCTEPPMCLHGKSTLKRTVVRRDSPNVGRTFFVCCNQGVIFQKTENSESLCEMAPAMAVERVASFAEVMNWSSIRCCDCGLR